MTVETLGEIPELGQAGRLKTQETEPAPGIALRSDVISRCGGVAVM